MSNLKIEVPTGMVINYDHFTKTNEIVFLPIKSNLPKQWTLSHFGIAFYNKDGFFIDEIINPSDSEILRHCLPSKKLAEQMLIFTQLITMRECYRDGWVPDYCGEYQTFVIEQQNDEIITDFYYSKACVFAFQTAEIRDTFLTNFREMLNACKTLWA